MKKTYLITVFLLSFLTGFSQNGDTLFVNNKNLKLENLHTGNSSYIVFMKKNNASPAERIILVKIKTEPTTYQNKKALEIKQQWDLEGVIHTATTVLDKTTAATLYHETWWKRQSYTAKFDFISKKVSFEGAVNDTIKSKITTEFESSSREFNLNWHSDLILFPTFPFKMNRTFAVPFYDPGFGNTAIAYYKIINTEILSDSNGKKIACWVMEHKAEDSKKQVSVQRFWISKKTKEVIKEEDQFPIGLRFKYKTGISVPI
jgi:hypothetical protein